MISIIICSYNRANILKITLDILSKESIHFDSIEIIIVDNLSNDETSTIIQKIKQLDSRIKYFLESKQGLSFARNRGIKEASSNWLLYLDDDAKLTKRNLEHVLYTINNYSFSLFTGVWKAWYLTSPPKWLPYSTGNYLLKGNNTIREIGNDYITGLIMIINKQKLIEIGGFPTNLGMKGTTVAYGEETYVEEEFKKRGWSVGINPNIVIDHLVGEHKYKLSWHLEAAFAKGRDGQIIGGVEPRLNRFGGLVISVFTGWLRPLAKFVIKTNYYWQNFVIDYWGGVQFQLGRLKIDSKTNKCF